MDEESRFLHETGILMPVAQRESNQKSTLALRFAGPCAIMRVVQACDVAQHTESSPQGWSGELK